MRRMSWSMPERTDRNDWVALGSETRRRFTLFCSDQEPDIIWEGNSARWSAWAFLVAARYKSFRIAARAIATLILTA